MSGCRTELFSKLDEQEAAEMMAILLTHGISCSKECGGEDGGCRMFISKSKIPSAMEILHFAGYPRGTFEDMGSVFVKKGLVSTPLEERARYIYAVSQELAHTISCIDGVSQARVHIAIPENNPLLDTLPPSSASVFIKYRHDANIQQYIPLVKHFVATSVEGLSLEKVSVIAVPGPSPDPSRQRMVSVLGVVIDRLSLPAFWLITALPGGLFIICAILLSLPVFRRGMTKFKTTAAAKRRA
jgi:type III secretion protein J